MRVLGAALAAMLAALACGCEETAREPEPQPQPGPRILETWNSSGDWAGVAARLLDDDAARAVFAKGDTAVVLASLLGTPVDLEAWREMLRLRTPELPLASATHLRVDLEELARSRIEPDPKLRAHLVPPDEPAPPPKPKLEAGFVEGAPSGAQACAMHWRMPSRASAQRRGAQIRAEMVDEDHITLRGLGEVLGRPMTGDDLVPFRLGVEEDHVFVAVGSIGWDDLELPAADTLLHHRSSKGAIDLAVDGVTLVLKVRAADGRESMTPIGLEQPWLDRVDSLVEAIAPVVELSDDDLLGLLSLARGQPTVELATSVAAPAGHELVVVIARTGQNSDALVWRLGDTEYGRASALAIALLRRAADPAIWVEVDGERALPGVLLSPRPGSTYGDCAVTVDVLKTVGFDVVRFEIK